MSRCNAVYRVSVAIRPAKPTFTTKARNYFGISDDDDERGDAAAQAQAEEVTLRRLRVPKNKAGYFGVHLKPGHPKPLPGAGAARWQGVIWATDFVFSCPIDI